MKGNIKQIEILVILRYINIAIHIRPLENWSGFSQGFPKKEQQYIYIQGCSCLWFVDSILTIFKETSFICIVQHKLYLLQDFNPKGEFCYLTYIQIIFYKY